MITTVLIGAILGVLCGWASIVAVCAIVERDSHTSEDDAMFAYDPQTIVRMTEHANFRVGLLVSAGAIGIAVASRVVLLSWSPLELAVNVILAMLLFAIALEDALTLEIAAELAQPALLFALLRALLLPYDAFTDAIAGGVIGLIVFNVTIFVVEPLYKRFKRRRGGVVPSQALGRGDSTILLILGLCSGALPFTLAFTLAVVFTGLFSLILHRARMQPIPFGPALAFMTLVAMLWDQLAITRLISR